MEIIHQICDLCKSEIAFGSPYIAICYNIENMERNHIRQSNTVNVVSSQQIYTMCGKCGNRRNAATATAVLDNAFKLGHPRLN